MSMNKSIFIITMGPMGSGKGYILNSLLDIVRTYNPTITTMDVFKYSRIDDYIEMDEEFIEKSLDIVIDRILKDDKLTRDIQRLDDIKDCYDEIVDYQNKVDGFTIIPKIDEIAQELESIYNSYRLKYDIINYRNLIQMIRNRDNIVFETTGTNRFDWLFTSTPLSNLEVLGDYTIIVVYPYVKDDMIIARALNRFTTRVSDLINICNVTKNTTKENEEYINYVIAASNGNKIGHKKIEVPRLPVLFDGITPLSKSISTIQNNISQYIVDCMSTVDTKVSLIILFDNNRNVPIISIDMNCGEPIKFTKYCSSLEDFKRNYNLHLSKSLLLALDNIQSKCDMEGGDKKSNYRKYLRYKNIYLNKKKQII